MSADYTNLTTDQFEANDALLAEQGALDHATGTPPPVLVPVEREDAAGVRPKVAAAGLAGAAATVLVGVLARAGVDLTAEEGAALAALAAFALGYLRRE